jgi:hypothetical protein
MRMRPGAPAAFVALIAWAVVGAVELPVRHPSVEPTRGIAVYLGVMISAAALLFASPRILAARSLVGWCVSAAAIACATLLIVGPSHQVGSVVVPGYIVHELPAAALGVTLLLTAAGATAARLRVPSQVTARSAGYLAPTLLRCFACLLLVVSLATHLLWLGTSWIGDVGGLIGWSVRRSIPAQLWIASFVQLLVTARWPAAPVAKAFSLLCVGSTWTALAADLPSDALAFILVLAGCSTMTLAASRQPATGDCSSD